MTISLLDQAKKADEACEHAVHMASSAFSFMPAKPGYKEYR